MFNTYPPPMRVKGTPSACVTFAAFFFAIILEVNVILQLYLYGLNFFKHVTGPNTLLSCLHVLLVFMQLLGPILLVGYTWLSQYMPSFSTGKLVLVVSLAFVTLHYSVSFAMLVLLDPTEEPVKEEVRMILTELIINFLIYVPELICILSYIEQLIERVVTPFYSKAHYSVEMTPMINYPYVNPGFQPY